MQIVIATGNKYKAAEITRILQENPDPRFKYISLPNSDITEPDEPYPTFMENARHKAKYYSDMLGCAALAEDAGMCVRALNGFPGVRTKDFVMECGGIANSLSKLQAMLRDTTDYTTSFTCAAALYIPQLDQFITYEGVDLGTLSFTARGTQGFGLDPIFIPDGYQQTMAELGESVKNQIGHRALAMRGIAKQLYLSKHFSAII
jgi:XTP/dITP diphosphohydrolase